MTKNKQVIQTDNICGEDVSNGDFGQIAKIERVEREVTVRFNEHKVIYDFHQLESALTGPEGWHRVIA